MFHPLGEPTTQTPIRPASATSRSRSVLLVLALLAALGAPLAGAAPAAAQADARLELTPAKAVNEVNRPIAAFHNIIPNFGVDYMPIGIGGNISFGGSNMGALWSGLSAAAKSFAGLYDHEASRQARVGSYARREQD